MRTFPVMGDRALPSRAVVWRIGLQAVALVAVVYLLWRARLVLQLASVAAVFAAAAATPVLALERRGWPRGLAVAAVLGGSLLLALGAIASIVPLVVEQATSFAQALPSLVQRAQDSRALAWLEENFQIVSRSAALLERNVSTALGAALSAASGLASFVVNLVVTVALTAFLLTSGRALWRGALEWVHPARRPRVERVGVAVRRAVASYVVGALAMAAIGAVVTAVTTVLLGVPYWLPLAVVTGILAIVPYIGAFVSGALVTVTTFLAAGQTAGLVALGVFVAYQQLEGIVLQPLVQRRAIELNPLVVAFAALVGTTAAGIYGGVMAIPIAAATKVVAQDALDHRRARWRTRRDPAAADSSGGPTAPPERASSGGPAPH
jgi:predicted PurR-regulated permease PerM